ncbi:PASTA domain-containing protein, partial [Nocardioides sp. GCM10030258]
IEKGLESRGVQVKVTDSEFSDEIAEGAIISQNPKTGVVYKGDTVELVVSKGPELVAVPAVRYLSTKDAVDKLEALGFKVKKEHASIFLSGQVAWATDPEAGERVKKGSRIILYIV